MSWMKQLVATYENNIAVQDKSEIQIAPVSHKYVNAQIEITLDGEGNFKNACIIERDEAATLIPVTEASAGRSSGLAPHPLSDTLSYIAGDYSRYCKSQKEKKSSEDKFQQYSAGLKKWVESRHSHPKVRAVYRYLSQGETISDLIKSGLIRIREDGTFEEQKINEKPYEKVMVRFKIHEAEQETDCTWEDSSLIRAYMEYYLEEWSGRTGICCFLGEEKMISDNHPKGIVASDYGAKLVSANDTQGYTYRGRFQDAEQACALSYEASQKAHNALTWLDKKYGVAIGRKDKRTFICWNPQGKKIPDIFGEFGLEEEETAEGPKQEVPYRKKLIKTFQGYQGQFDEADSVIIMGLDAATTGRLSVTYYHELAASDFLNRILYWGETCSWYFLKFTAQKRPYYAEDTPVFQQIVKCAFGTERKQGEKEIIEVDDRVLKEQTQRLIKCMIEQQPVPYDIVHALKLRASAPMAYSGINRERILSTACAMADKYYYEKKAERKVEKREMKLNLDNRDRSYLFGRLLAVCEHVERMTYDRGESRDPNAIRLQSAYVNHPMQTWKILQGLLNPYFQKLRPGSREYYKNIISSIVTAFETEDVKVLNQEISEAYLLGYYLQRAELKQKNEEKNENTEKREEE